MISKLVEETFSSVFAPIGGADNSIEPLQDISKGKLSNITKNSLIQISDLTPKLISKSLNIPTAASSLMQKSLVGNLGKNLGKDNLDLTIKMDKLEKLKKPAVKAYNRFVNDKDLEVKTS